MTLRSRLAIPVAVAALAASLSGCTGSGSADSTNGPTRSPESSSSAPPSSTDTVQPAWRDKYTKKQLDAYEAALYQWETYDMRVESVYREGKATPTAKELFEEYFIGPYARSKFQELKTYQQVNVRIEGRAEVYWSRASRIGENSTSVLIQQCVSYSATRAFQDGEPAPQTGKYDKPLTRVIDIEKPDARRGWQIYGVVEDVKKKKVYECDPDAL